MYYFSDSRVYSTREFKSIFDFLALSIEYSDCIEIIVNFTSVSRRHLSYYVNSEEAYEYFRRVYPERLERKRIRSGSELFTAVSAWVDRYNIAI